MTPTLAVLTPTRGLVHSRTVEAVMRAVEVAEGRGLVQRVDGQWWHWAHGLPIPEAHERVTEAGLATGADLLWMIEDDNVPPAEALAASVRTMGRTGAGVVAVTYPVGTRGTRWDSVYREHGEVLFTGLGITLVSRGVLEKMERPWFSLDRWYGRVPDGEGGTKLGLLDKPFPRNVGGVDVVFGIRVREEAGSKIMQVPDMVGGHLRIKTPGATSGSGVNDRPHQVAEWNTIDRDQSAFVAEDRSRFRWWDPAWAKTFQQLRPWVTGFWVADRYLGGSYDAVHDSRLRKCFDRFPARKRVLELGSLEGGHTVPLARWARSVVGVEGREHNVRKAEFILEVHQTQNAAIVHGNLEEMRLADLGNFDLVFSVGVLYHMPEPLKLIAQCADAAPDLFLWTHYSKTGERMPYAEHGIRDPLSGLSKVSTWLPKDELLAELRDRYDEVEIVDEEETPAGPAITIAARQKRQRRPKRSSPVDKRRRPVNKRRPPADKDADKDAT